MSFEEFSSPVRQRLRVSMTTKSILFLCVPRSFNLSISCVLTEESARLSDTGIMEKSLEGKVTHCFFVDIDSFFYFLSVLQLNNKRHFQVAPVYQKTLYRSEYSRPCLWQETSFYLNGVTPDQPNFWDDLINQIFWRLNMSKLIE